METTKKYISDLFLKEEIPLEEIIRNLKLDVKRLEQKSKEELKLEQEKLNLEKYKAEKTHLLRSIQIISDVLNPFSFSELKIPIILKDEINREEAESILMTLIKKLKDV